MSKKYVGHTTDHYRPLYTITVIITVIIIIILEVSYCVLGLGGGGTYGGTLISDI